MIALRLKSWSLHVRAPRQLVFEVLSSGPPVGLAGDDQAVETETETECAGEVIKTLERVTLEPPRRITYRWLTGSVIAGEEEILFEELDKETTRMSYRGRFRPPFSLSGWTRGVTVVRPIFNQLIRSHLDQGKRLAEARYRTCPPAGSEK